MDDQIPIRDYVESRFKSQDRLLTELRKADEKRDELYEENNEHRLSVLNFHAEQMKDLRSMMAPRESVELIRREVEGLINWKSEMIGRTWALTAIYSALSTAALIIAIYAALARGI